VSWCQDCGARIGRPGRGRPGKRCAECARIAERLRGRRRRIVPPPPQCSPDPEHQTFVDRTLARLLSG
jgi:hypothetical protein